LSLQERRGIGWWKVGIWRLKGMRGNTGQGICPVCRKDKGWSHILGCKGTKNSKDELLERKLTSIDLKIRIRIVSKI
jgi:hypothetical protein